MNRLRESLLGGVRRFFKEIIPGRPEPLVVFSSTYHVPPLENERMYSPGHIRIVCDALNEGFEGGTGIWFRNFIEIDESKNTQREGIRVGTDDRISETQFKNRLRGMKGMLISAAIAPYLERGIPESVLQEIVSGIAHGIAGVLRQ